MSLKKALVFLLALFMVALTVETSGAQDPDEGQQDDRRQMEEREDRGRRRGQRRQGRGGRGRNSSDPNALTVGEMAPDFTLKSLDGNSTTELSQFQGEKPVVLFFGSYT